MFASLILASLVQVPAITATKTIEGMRTVALAGAPTGSRFAVSYEDGSVAIMDAKTRTVVRQFAKRPQAAMTVTFSRDGLFLATGDESGRIWIEDTRTGKKVREYRTHTRGVQKVSFDPTRKYLLSDGRDDYVHIYDLDSSAPKEKLKIAGAGANFFGATFNPKNSRQFAVGILAPSSRVYDASTGKVVCFMTGQDSQGALDVSFHPNGTRAMTGGKDATAVIYDVRASYKKIATLRGHQDWVVYTLFSPDGRFIATASSDGTVKLWNAITFQRLIDLKEQESTGSPLAFTGDGTTLVTVNSFGHLQLHTLWPGPKPVVPAKKPVKKPTRKRRG